MIAEYLLYSTGPDPAAFLIESIASISVLATVQPSLLGENDRLGQALIKYM
jgi:hypothetical protein